MRLWVSKTLTVRSPGRQPAPPAAAPAPTVQPTNPGHTPCACWTSHWPPAPPVAFVEEKNHCEWLFLIFFFYPPHAITTSNSTTHIHSIVISLCYKTNQASMHCSQWGIVTRASINIRMCSRWMGFPLQANHPCTSHPLPGQVSRSGGSKCWQEALFSPLQHPSHHVESMKCPKSSHCGAGRVVLVWRAHQQGALHACFQGPVERDAGEGDRKLTRGRLH